MNVRAFKDRCRSPTIRNGRSGFTLIELLVVIAIIAILAAMLLPVLSKAKMRAYGAACMNNLKQMQMGATMYKDDFNDVLLPNAPFTPSILVGGAKAWIDTSLLGTQFTNRAAFSSALLAPYLSGQVNVYKCPADRPPTGNMDRLLSYSMNGQMGAVYMAPAKFNDDAPAKQYVKYPDIRVPSPSDAFVFCEENAISQNDGFLEIDSHNGTFPDTPAAYHNNGCGFSFADGHAEIHKWMTKTLANAKGHSPPVSGGRSNADWLWFSQHAASDY